MTLFKTQGEDSYTCILGNAFFNAILTAMATAGTSQALDTFKGISILMTLFTTNGLS
jgi:hypothetical protein